MDTIVIPLQETINFLPDGVLIVDNQSRIVLANTQASKLFGYPPDTLTGYGLLDLIPARYHAVHPGHVRGFFHDPAVRSMGEARSLSGLRLDGTEFDVDVALSPVVLDDRKLVVAVIRDMTVQKNMERALHWRNEQLEAINIELERFGFTISHDLKSPLANIHAIIHLLTRELPADKKDSLKEHIQQLNHTLFAMSALIAGVAAYSKPTLADDAQEEVALAEIMREMSYLLLLPPHIELEIQGELPVLWGNKTKLLQVFLNLVSNAIKYNDKAAGLIRVRGQQTAQETRVWVEDNGPGIAPELRKKVFTLFEKGVSERTDSQGIGLAIVHKVIQEQGGRITIHDSALGGASFQIVWPGAVRQPAAIAPRPATA